MSDKNKLIEKYSKDFNKMFKTAANTMNCNSTKCKKEYDEVEKYKSEVMKNIFKLTEEESKTKTFKGFGKERSKIQKKFRENKDVILYLKNIKNGIKNDKNVVSKYYKAYKVYQRDLKKVLKEYHKTEIGKQYRKKFKKLLNEITNNIKTIALSKCSFEKCLKLHKEGLQLIKALTTKLCKEKIEKSCKISKAIDKIDIKNFNHKDNQKLSKMIKKGLF
jgi:hypothetical protein